MILYFSGTGNSKYVAERIALMICEDLVSLNDKIKLGDHQEIKNEKHLIIVAPTYAWRLPRVVEAWLNRTEIDTEKVWFVMTCGGEIGNAAKYNQRLCSRKHLTYMGTKQILMPENYIAMFGVPDWKDAKNIIDRAEPDIQLAGEQIKKDIAFAAPRNNLYDRMMSGVINGPFYKLFVKSNAFYSKSSCISCGKCASVCPLNNITLQDGKPIWGNNCTHCMSCISYCPKKAIEYGTKSIGKPRYTCRKNVQ